MNSGLHLSSMLLFDFQQKEPEPFFQLRTVRRDRVTEAELFELLGL